MAETERQRKLRLLPHEAATTDKRTRRRPVPVETERIRQGILSSLRSGLTRAWAAKYNGIAPDTLYHWCTKYEDFDRECDRAEAIAIARNLAVVQKEALEGSWQAATWYLERRDPRSFGPRVEVEQRISADVVVHEPDRNQMGEVLKLALEFFPELRAGIEGQQKDVEVVDAAPGSIRLLPPDPDFDPVEQRGIDLL